MPPPSKLQLVSSPSRRQLAPVLLWVFTDVVVVVVAVRISHSQIRKAHRNVIPAYVLFLSRRTRLLRAVFAYPPTDNSASFSLAHEFGVFFVVVGCFFRFPVNGFPLSSLGCSKVGKPIFAAQCYGEGDRGAG